MSKGINFPMQRGITEMFNNTQIQILGTIREYEFAIAKGAYALANRIREANRDLREDFDRADFEEFNKSAGHYGPDGVGR